MITFDYITIGISVSFFVLAVARILYAYYISNTNEQKKIGKGIAVLFFFFASFALMLMYVVNKFIYGDESIEAQNTYTIRDVIPSICAALQNVCQLFSSDGDYYDFKDVICNSLQNNRPLMIFSYIFGSTFFIIAPVITFTFIIEILANVADKIKVKYSTPKKVFAFSKLNDNSLNLAKDIRTEVLKRDKHAKIQIIFFDCFHETDENEFKLQNEASEIKAICLNEDILNTSFVKKSRFINNRSSKREYNFIIIGENEAKNLNQTLTLIDRYKEIENTYIYSFVKTSISNTLITTALKGHSEELKKKDKSKEIKIKVRRIKESSSLILNMLYKRNFFDEAEDIKNSYLQTVDELIETDNYFGKQKEKNLELKEKTETENLKIVILGCGSFGSEMLKNLAWYGQIPDRDMKIYVYDKNPDIKNILEVEVPELFNENINPEYTDFEKHPEYKQDNNYNIFINEGFEDGQFDVGSQAFIDYLDKLGFISHIFVLLGDDEMNTEIAMKVRSKLSAKNLIKFAPLNLKNEKLLLLSPRIITFIEDGERMKVIEKNAADMASHRNEKYHIEFIGYIKEIYSFKGIMESPVERATLARHYRKNDVEKFYLDEYSYKSSMARIVRARIKRRLDIRDIDEKDTTFERAEHAGWNAYVRSIGYVGGLGKDVDGNRVEIRNDMAKIHYNLVPFDLLDDKDKKKDSIDLTFEKYRFLEKYENYENEGVRESVARQVFSEIWEHSKLKNEYAGIINECYSDDDISKIEKLVNTKKEIINYDYTSLYNYIQNILKNSITEKTVYILENVLLFATDQVKAVYFPGRVKEINDKICSVAELLTDVINSVLTDYPQYYYYNGYNIEKIANDNFSYQLTFEYDAVPDEHRSAIKNTLADISEHIYNSYKERRLQEPVFYTKTIREFIDKRIENNLDVDTGSDYYIILSIYRWFMYNVKYDVNAGNNIYSALVEKKANNEGLINAFKYVLFENGIFAFPEFKDISDEWENKWCVVEIDGGFYNVDIKKGVIAKTKNKNPYDYFAMSDSKYLKRYNKKASHYPNLLVCDMTFFDDYNVSKNL